MIVFGVISPHPPIILPEIGGNDTRKVQATIDALEEAARLLAEARPDTLIIIAPHKDHGFDVPLYYLGKHLPKTIAIERILVTEPSDQYYFDLGRQAGKAAAQDDRRTAIIASGDLSHVLKADGPYGFNPAGPILDEIIVRAVRENQPQALLQIDPTTLDQGAECGLRSILYLFGALADTSFRSQILAYEGPFGVGYLTAVFGTKPPTPRQTGPKATVEPRSELNLAALARVSLKHYLETHQLLEAPAELPKPLQQPAGVFVSLHTRDDELRGCIGTVLPTKPNLASEVIANAIAAGTRDPRFTPVELTELDQLSLSVDVLSQPQPIKDQTKLNPKRDGLIVTAADDRQGVLLPDLEGVDSVEQQIAICRDKAGIGPNEPVSLAVFQAERHLETTDDGVSAA